MWLSVTLTQFPVLRDATKFTRRSKSYFGFPGFCGRVSKNADLLGWAEVRAGNNLESRMASNDTNEDE